MPAEHMGTASGLGCGPGLGVCPGTYASSFTSGAAAAHVDPPATMPEPTSLALLGSGLVTLVARRRRRALKPSPHARPFERQW
jgi:hypothetical protein